MLTLRPVASHDLDALLGLAKRLDSVNLPADREFLRERIAASERSFAAVAGRAEQDWRDGVYVFVLEDREGARVVGTSSILGKTGRR